MNLNMIESNNLDNIYELNSVEEIYDNKINYNNMNIIPIEYFNNGFFYKYYNKIFNNEYNIKDFKIIYDIIQSLNLTNFEKNLILVRFRRINLFCINNFKSVSNYYEKSKIFIIICGILNPSLLSINNNQDHTNYTLLFWTVWTLQLLVSLITSFISFYKWDKKYFLYSSYKSKINQEIWLYLELTSRYSVNIIENENENENDPDDNKNHIHITEPTHKNKLNLFLERIEYLFKKLKDCDLEIETNDEDKEIISNKIIKNNKNKNKIRHISPKNINMSESPDDKNLSESPDDKDVSDTPDDNNNDNDNDNNDDNADNSDNADNNV
jgi:hypothetical protein